MDDDEYKDVARYLMATYSPGRPEYRAGRMIAGLISHNQLLEEHLLDAQARVPATEDQP